MFSSSTTPTRPPQLTRRIRGGTSIPAVRTKLHQSQSSTGVAPSRGLTVFVVSRGGLGSCSAGFRGHGLGVEKSRCLGRLEYVCGGLGFVFELFSLFILVVLGLVASMVITSVLRSWRWKVTRERSKFAAFRDWFRFRGIKARFLVLGERSVITEFKVRAKIHFFYSMT